MPAKLTTEQNESLRQFVRESLLPKFGSIRAIAKETGMAENALQRFLSGQRGSSLGNASLLAALAESTPWEAIGLRGNKKTRRLALVPGYTVAEQLVQEFDPRIREATWSHLRRLELAELPTHITPAQLSSLAKAFEELQF